MNRWLVRSTVPMALLIALGLVSLIATMVVPATTVETQYDTVTTVGAPASQPVVTVDHQGAALAIVLLVIASGSFAGAIVLGVLRRLRRRRQA
jgi:amino acid transporter